MFCRQPSLPSFTEQCFTGRGILFFIAVCLAVGNIFENFGVLAGFPFGRYYFTDLMGPKLFFVPVLLGLAYVGMAYLSLTLARLIVVNGRSPSSGTRVIVVPLVAAIIMVAWDLAMDPVWGTLLHAWVWLKGGSCFGVPVSNFAGWYLTVYVIYQIFALYLRRRTINPRQLPSGYWKIAVMFYAVSAAGNILLAIPHGAPTVVSIPRGCNGRGLKLLGPVSSSPSSLWGPLQYGPGQGLHPARRKECQPES
jgi:uncharacterized membrane protein